MKFLRLHPDSKENENLISIKVEINIRNYDYHSIKASWERESERVRERIVSPRLTWWPSIVRARYYTRFWGGGGSNSSKLSISGWGLGQSWKSPRPNSRWMRRHRTRAPQARNREPDAAWWSYSVYQRLQQSEELQVEIGRTCCCLLQVLLLLQLLPRAPLRAIIVHYQTSISHSFCWAMAFAMAGILCRWQNWAHGCIRSCS